MAQKGGVGKRIQRLKAAAAARCPDVLGSADEGPRAAKLEMQVRSWDIAAVQDSITERRLSAGANIR